MNYVIQLTAEVQNDLQLRLHLASFGGFCLVHIYLAGIDVIFLF
jgi:hypothetical protein